MNDNLTSFEHNVEHLLLRRCFKYTNLPIANYINTELLKSRKRCVLDRMERTIVTKMVLLGCHRYCIFNLKKC